MAKLGPGSIRQASKKWRNIHPADLFQPDFNP